MQTILDIKGLKKSYRDKEVIHGVDFSVYKLEKGLGISSWHLNGLYIAVVILAFTAITVVKTQKDYVRNG
jgi:hypothetical protein